MSEDQDQEIPIGATIAGKYRVERLLGAGGMGFVVAATNLSLGTKVALKFVRGANGVVQDDWRIRLQREAQVAASLTSPHVARVHDFGEHEGLPYLVMEHLSGRDLSERIAEGPIPPAIAAGFLVQACEAIAEAHALGIIHRDLKPQNLFLVDTAAGGTRLKVLDFGIAKRSESMDFRTADRSLTQTGTMLGSPLYMSPEQLTAPKEVDLRSDLWALGVILHEMLVGTPPFDGTTLIDLSMKICTQTPIPVNTLRPEIPEAFAAIVLRCLEKRPEDRYPLVEDLAAMLLPLAAPEALGGPGSTGQRRAAETARNHERAVPRSGPEAQASATKRPLAPPTGGDTARAWEEATVPAARAFPLWPIVAAFLLLGAGLSAFLVSRRNTPKTPPETAPVTALPTATSPAVDPQNPEGISVTALPSAALGTAPRASLKPVPLASAGRDAAAREPSAAPKSTASAAPVPTPTTTAKPPTGANGSPVITD